MNESNGAKTSVYLQAYSFTSNPIADAIVRDAARGQTVRTILDHSQEIEKSSKLSELWAAHIPVIIDHVHKIAHNKIIIIIDGQEVITGSFNFTAAAENDNAENLLILHDQARRGDIGNTGMNRRRYARQRMAVHPELPHWAILLSRQAQPLPTR